MRPALRKLLLFGMPPIVAGAVTLILDQCTDTDGTPIASHAIGPTNVPATSWQSLTGTGVTIQSNKASTSGGVAELHVCDPGKADIDYSTDWTASGGQSGVALRCTDASNYWRVWRGIGATNINLDEVNATVVTNRGTAAASGNGTIRVVASGATITVYWNGTSMFSYTSATFNQGATKAGLRNNNSSATTWDNITMVG
ncbi:MAG: hypothetical protein WCF84_26745 [Anaerolineae bacterium]